MSLLLCPICTGFFDTDHELQCPACEQAPTEFLFKRLRELESKRCECGEDSILEWSFFATCSRCEEIQGIEAELDRRGEEVAA